MTTNQLRTATATKVAPVASIKLINAIGSCSYMARFPGGHAAGSLSGSDAGDKLYRALVSISESYALTSVTLTIGAGDPFTINL